MKDLPKEVKPYKKTKIFEEDTIPKGILNDHKTLPGVWGVINIIEGELDYTIHGNEEEKLRLDKDNFGIVEPEVLHKVAPIDKVKFYVEFYK